MVRGKAFTGGGVFLAALIPLSPRRGHVGTGLSGALAFLLAIRCPGMLGCFSPP